MEIPSGLQIKQEEGEDCTWIGGAPGNSNLTLQLQEVKLESQRIAAALQDRSAGGTNFQDGGCMKTFPKTAKQEKTIRENLAGVKIEGDRSSVQMEPFVINGLQPSTRAAAVVSDLQVLGVTTKYVTQLRDRISLLPLFIFNAPRSRAQSLKQVKRLCGQDVLIQSYGDGNSPSKQSQTIGHQAENSSSNGQRRLGWENPCDQKYPKWSCAQMQAAYHAGQCCDHGMQICDAPSMPMMMPGRHAPNCCCDPGWKRHIVKNRRKKWCQKTQATLTLTQTQQCNRGAQIQRSGYRASGHHAANCGSGVGWKRPIVKKYRKRYFKQTNALTHSYQHGSHGEKIQNYRAPSMKMEMPGHDAPNFCSDSGWRRRDFKLFPNLGCTQLPAMSPAGQRGNNSAQTQSYRAPFKQEKMSGHEAPNCSMSRQSGFVWKEPKVEKCTEQSSKPAPMQTCQAGPSRGNGGPNSAESHALCLLRDIKKEV